MATVAGIAVVLLGILVPALGFLYDGAWFSATLVSGLIYWWMMRDPLEVGG